MNRRSEFHTSRVSVPWQRYKKKTHLVSRTKIFPSLSYLHHQQKFKHIIAVSVCIWHHHHVIKKHHNTYVPIPHPLYGLRVVHHARSLSSSWNPHTHISSTCHLLPLTPTLWWTRGMIDTLCFWLHDCLFSWFY